MHNPMRQVLGQRCTNSSILCDAQVHVSVPHVTYSKTSSDNCYVFEIVAHFDDARDQDFGCVIEALSWQVGVSAVSLVKQGRHSTGDFRN